MKKLRCPIMWQTIRSICGDAVAIWRVGNHDGLVERLFELVKVTLFNADDVFDTCVLYVVQGYLYGLAVVLTSANLSSPQVFVLNILYYDFNDYQKFMQK